MRMFERLMRGKQDHQHHGEWHHAVPKKSRTEQRSLV